MIGLIYQFQTLVRVPRTSLMGATLTLAAVLLAASNASAATYYVAPNGNDGNSCAQAQSPSAPKRNIMGGNGGLACLAAGAGDKLLIRGGTYNESLTTNTQNWPSGTSWSNAATIAAYPGETATIARAVALGGPAAYIILDGLVVDGTNCSNCNDLIWVGNGAHHIRFFNVEGKNNSAGQIVAVNPDGSFVEFIGGSYHDALGGNVSAIPPGGYCFYISGKDNTFEKLKVYNCVAYGFHIYVNKNDHPGASPDRNIVRYSEIYGIVANLSYSFGTGILLGTGVGNIAYDNVVRDIAGPGISVGNGASGAKIYNNTSVRNQYGVTTANSSGLIIKNNILADNTGTPYNDYGNSSSVTFANNFCTSSGVGCAVLGNPLFVDSAQRNYRLQAGSPAIDRGAVLTDIPPTDIAGTARPQGVAWDLGAYEYSTITTGTPPAAPTNVRVVR